MYCYGKTSALGLTTNTATALIAKASLICGEGVDIVIMPCFIGYNVQAGGTTVPEKLNSRSATPRSRNNADASAHLSPIVVITAINHIVHSAYRSHPRYFPVGDTTRFLQFQGAVIPLSSNSGVWSEDTVGPLAQRRSKSRGGYGFNYGNGCGLHKKTGGGAFEMTSRPHFDNDITWVEPSAWRNGMSQGDVWSMQLFGEPAVPDPIGKEFVFQQSMPRAACW